MSLLQRKDGGIYRQGGKKAIGLFSMDTHWRAYWVLDLCH